MAGVSSLKLSGLVARTRNSWLPTATNGTAYVEIQVANGALSSEHSKVEPTWSAENSKSAVELVVGEGGPALIVVCGAATTVQLWVAGDWSVLPAASLARTSSWCAPSCKFMNSTVEAQELNEAES